MNEKEQEIRKLARQVMTSEYVETWMHIPLSALNYLSPADAIRCGKYEQVKNLLFAVKSGGHR